MNNTEQPKKKKSGFKTFLIIAAVIGILAVVVDMASGTEEEVYYDEPAYVEQEETTEPTTTTTEATTTTTEVPTTTTTTATTVADAVYENQNIIPSSNDRGAMCNFTLDEFTERFNEYGKLWAQLLNLEPTIFEIANEWIETDTTTDNVGASFTAFVNPNFVINAITQEQYMLTAMCDTATGNVISVYVTVPEKYYNKNSVEVQQYFGCIALSTFLHNGEYTQDTLDTAYKIYPSIINAAAESKSLSYENILMFFVTSNDVSIVITAASDDYIYSNRANNIVYAG